MIDRKDVYEKEMVWWNSICRDLKKVLESHSYGKVDFLKANIIRSLKALISSCEDEASLCSIAMDEYARKIKQREGERFEEFGEAE